MALVIADRVQETTTTTGTGTITLAGAVTGFQSFAAVGNGNTTHYCITSGSDWEVGIGTYSTTGPTLARTTILASSAAGAAITLAGTSTVFCTYPASKSFNLDQVLPLADGGTGATSAPAAQAALMGFATTATAGGTTTLTNTSSVYQVFTGSSAQTVALPSTATLAQGWFFHICNNSTGTLTVQTSTAVSLGTVPPGLTVMTSCVDTAVNTAAAWEVGFTDFSTITGTGNNVLATNPTLSSVVLSAGTATAGTAPLKFTSGTNLGTAEAGAIEYDGNTFFSTEDTTSGRGCIPSEKFYRQTGNGTTTTAGAIADFFPATSSISLAASTLYEIEVWAYFLKTTAGTVTFTMTASSAPTWMNGYYVGSGVAGITTAAAATTGWAGSAAATTAAWAATGSLTTAVNHGYRFKIQILTNLATNWRMRYTSNTGTTQSLAGSYYIVRELPSASTGTFVA